MTAAAIEERALGAALARRAQDRAERPLQLVVDLAVLRQPVRAGALAEVRAFLSSTVEGYAWTARRRQVVHATSGGASALQAVAMLRRAHTDGLVVFATPTDLDDVAEQLEHDSLALLLFAQLYVDRLARATALS